MMAVCACVLLPSDTEWGSHLGETSQGTSSY